MTTKKPKLVEVHARLFAEDVRDLKKIALERGSAWHSELRQLVRRALKGEKREVIVIDKLGGEEP